MRGNPAEAIQRQNAADKVNQTFIPSGGFAAEEVASQVDSFAAFSGITFPAGLGDDPAQPVFMTYLPKKITSAVGGTMGDMSFSSVNVTGISQVALPIPTGLNVTYAQGWDQTDVNAVQGGVMRTGAFGAVAGGLRDMAEENSRTTVGDVGNAMLAKMDMSKEEFMGAVDNIKAQGMGAISSIMSKIPQIGISGNTAAGVALGTAGKLLGPAMSTAAGFSSFSQVMAHYQGPAFRNFNFTYTLRPLSPKDQQNIIKIVNFFKIASAPSQISNGLFRLYETPYVFKIGFYSRKGEMKDVNRIAHCACTNVAVSYGGDRFQTFSGTNSPVETNIALSFKEIELITRTEMEEGY